MTIGITPRAAYFASTTSTRTDGGMAAYGIPGSSMMSISADMSLPITTSRATPPWPGCVWTFVVTPSMMECARPLIVTTSTTRISGTQTVEQQFPKSSYAGGGGPKGPATVLVRGNDRASAQYAHSSAGGATKSDAQDGSDLAPTLNDTFHYPAY